MATIPQSHRDLLLDETRAFACLATRMADGTPQLTPLWFNTRGENILVNSAKGRVKDRNMRARPEVALLILDPRDPYRYVEIRGRVVKITEEQALEHINTLSLKYRQKPWVAAEGQIRVTYEIQPESIFAD